MWFELTLLLAFVSSVLVMSMRGITHETNPFIFMAIVTALSSACLFVYCFASAASLTFTPAQLRLACMAGSSVALLDLGFIFMFRKGAPVSVAMPIFRVSAIMLSAFLGLLLFKDELSANRAIGILLACIAVYLLNSKPTKVVS